MLKMTRLTLMTILGLVIAAFSTNELQAAQVLFTPQLTIGEQYTDNIFLTPDNKENEFTTTTGLSLTGQMLWRTAGLKLNYSPSYSLYARNSDLDYWRHAANAQAWKDFTRDTRLDITDNFLKTEDPLDNSSQYSTGSPLQGPAIATNIFRRGRGAYWQNVAEARLQQKFGAQDLYYLSFENYVLRNLQTVQDVRISDYTINQPGAGLSYWFTPHWGVDAQVFYAKRDYTLDVDQQEYNGHLRLLRALTRTLSGFVEYRQTNLYYANRTRNDYQVYSPSAGIQYQFEKEAHISIGGGYYIQHIANQGNDENWLANSEIYKRWSYRSGYVDLTVRSGYDIQYAGTQDLGLDIYYAGQADFTYNFTRQFGSTAFGGYRYDKYPNQTPEHLDRLISAGAGLDYLVLRWLRLDLNYQFRKFISDFKADEYQENRVTLLVTLVPGTPFRIE